MSKVQTSHLHEWIDGSGVSEEIAELNLMSVTAKQARALLNWQSNGEGKEETLADGWWCGSVDPLTGEEVDFGQFKPNKPFQFSTKRFAKYLSPKSRKTEAIYLRMPSDNYWRQIIEDINEVVYITEGVKKSGVLLSLELATIALVGVWNGQQAKGRELIDSLKIFAQPGRTFVFVFDADLMTNMQVRAALEQLGKLLIGRGCNVRVAQWHINFGKGIDDFFVCCGELRVKRTIKEAISFDEWLENEPSEMVNPQTLTGKVWNYVSTSMADRLELDEFSLEMRYGGAPLVVPQAQAKVSEVFGTDVNRGYLVSSMMFFAKQHPYSDVREYLKNCRVLHPEAKGAIKGLCEVMGLVRNYERVLMSKWLTGAVMRAMKPGSKFDSVLIQKSAEGLGKTKLMSVLAGVGRFYETTADPSNKDFRQVTVGNWILELGEIENTFRRADIGALKMYITQTEDVFRVPYGEKAERFPRHFIFCGSTNSDEVITDPDGVRRWWVIEPTKRFNMDWVEKNRDKIWSEAVGLFEQEYSTFLDGEEVDIFKAQMGLYRTTKGYYPALEAMKEELKQQPFKLIDLLANKFQKFPGMNGYKIAQMDLAQDLKLLGFEGKFRSVKGEKNTFWTYCESGVADGTDFVLPDFLK